MTINQCCFNVGPTSKTAGKHWNNVGSTPRVCWVSNYFGYWLIDYFIIIRVWLDITKSKIIHTIKNCGRLQIDMIGCIGKQHGDNDYYDCMCVIPHINIYYLTTERTYITHPNIITKNITSTHETLTPCPFDVGPTSPTSWRRPNIKPALGQRPVLAG